MKEDDLARIREATAIQGLLPYLEAEVARMERALENRVLTALRNGTLTPDDALHAWMEKSAIRSIVTRFDQRIKVGQTVGADNKALLDTGVPTT